VLPAENGYRGEEIFVYGYPDLLGRNYVDSVDDRASRPTRVIYFRFHPFGGCGADDAYLRAKDSGPLRS